MGPQKVRNFERGYLFTHIVLDGGMTTKMNVVTSATKHIFWVLSF